MSRKLPVSLALALMACVIAYCTPGYVITEQVPVETIAPATAPLPAAGAQPATSAATPFPSLTPPATVLSPDLLGLPQVEQAKADLAHRIGVAIDSIAVVALELTTWSDASLGCPDPDMRYLQVPQDGLLIQLSAGGQVYDYHSGGDQAPFLCQPALTVDKTTPVFGEDILTHTTPEN